MGKEKLPEREQERSKLTLRISPELDAITKSKAEYIGVSQNSFLAMLIDIGLRHYEHKKWRCVRCGKNKAELQLEDGRFICEKCAQDMSNMASEMGY